MNIEESRLENAISNLRLSNVIFMKGKKRKNEIKETNIYIYIYIYINKYNDFDATLGVRLGRNKIFNLVHNNFPGLEDNPGKRHPNRLMICENIFAAAMFAGGGGWHSSIREAIDV
jgi:hypothetical protein